MLAEFILNSHIASRKTQNTSLDFVCFQNTYKSFILHLHIFRLSTPTMRNLQRVVGERKIIFVLQPIWKSIFATIVQLLIGRESKHGFHSNLNTRSFRKSLALNTTLECLALPWNEEHYNTDIKKCH